MKAHNISIVHIKIEVAFFLSLNEMKIHNKTENLISKKRIPGFTLDN